MEAAIGKAQSRLEQVTRDNEFMHNYTLRVMAMSDLTTMRNTAFEQGVKQGIEQGVKQGIEKGIEKGSIDIAKRALAKGLPAEVVQDLTGLSAGDIAALQTE
jgi:predicted transposase/invertase (TIGR01784 family)